MSKITESARGEQCQVRIPGICNRDPETVVFAHLNGGGMGMKHPDCEGAYCCSACHDVIDGRSPAWLTLADCDTIKEYVGIVVAEDFRQKLVQLMHHEGCVRTRKILIDKGLLVLK